MDGGKKQKQTEMVRDREAERALKRTRDLMNLASHDTPAFVETHIHTHAQTNKRVSSQQQRAK